MASVKPYAEAGRFKTFDSDQELAPGVRSVAAHGHTPGHTAYLIESRGQRLMLVGDLIHVAAVQFDRPEVTIAFDSDPGAAAATQANIFGALASDGTLLGAAHLQFPGLGRLRASGSSWQWVPVNYSTDTPLVDFLPRAAPVAGDKILTKTLPNAFAGTRLQDALNSVDRDQLVLVGFMAHMCVDATARAALDLGYQAFIVATATADRALPSVDGSVVPPAVVLRSTLAALGDCFATIFRHTDALLARRRRQTS